MASTCCLPHQPTHFAQQDLYWFWVEVLWAARTMLEACPAWRSSLIPSNRQAKGFWCPPVGALDPMVHSRDLWLSEGEWVWLPLAGGVEHTKAVLATQGILELFLQSRGLPSLGIWLLGWMGERHTLPSLTMVVLGHRLLSLMGRVCNCGTWEVVNCSACKKVDCTLTQIAY